MVLWSPSPKLMDYYNSKFPDKIILSTTDLLRYVKSKDVVIAGRRSWLTEPKYRNNYGGPFRKWAKWDEGFDNEISEIALREEEREIPIEMRHVAIMPDAKGKNEALRRMKNLKTKEEVRMYIEEGLLPKGFLGRLRKMDTWDKRINSVLENSINHQNARRETRSNISIYPWDEARLLNTRPGFKSPNQLLPVKGDEDQTHRLIEAIVKLMGRIGAFPEIKYLDKWLKMNQRDDLIKWLDEACLARSPLRYGDTERILREYLFEQMRKEFGIREKIRKILLPKSWINRGLQTMAYLSLGASAFLGASDAMNWAIAAVGLAPAGWYIFERYDVVPMTADRYGGPQWPFICTTGKRAYWNQYVKMMSTLNPETRAPGSN